MTTAQGSNSSSVSSYNFLWTHAVLCSLIWFCSEKYFFRNKKNIVQRSAAQLDSIQKLSESLFFSTNNVLWAIHWTVDWIANSSLYFIACKFSFYYCYIKNWEKIEENNPKRWVLLSSSKSSCTFSVLVRITLAPKKRQVFFSLVIECVRKRDDA